MTPGGGRRLGLSKCRHAGNQRGTDPRRARTQRSVTNVGDAGASEGFTPGGGVKRRETIKTKNQKPRRLRQRRPPPAGMPLSRKEKQIHHRDRVSHGLNRNLRHRAQQEQMSSWTAQEPENKERQRWTLKQNPPNALRTYLSDPCPPHAGP